ncbi:MAG TPA: T9SS type A sorting domain-containing protein [Ignavibacteria bacterium]
MNKSKYFFLLLSVLFLVSVAYSQSIYQNVMISNQNSPEEVSICINPKNLNQLVAGANIINEYYSSDGGMTWTWQTMSSTYGVWGDPIITVDTIGNFYFFHLSNPSSGSWIDRMVCQKSTNAGVTWSNGTYAGLNPPKLQDKEGIVVDRRNNYIHMTWTQFDVYGTSNPLDSSRILYTKSTDAGETWSTPVRIDKLGGDCVDADNTVEGAVPAVSPTGDIYVAWAGPKIRNSQFGIFFNKSTDDGLTWLANPIYVTDQPGGWDYMIPGIQRCNGLPQTVCDVSNGPFRGNIYINWTDSAGNGDHDVKCVKSTNGGLNWSSVKKVNDDLPGKEQFFTWMTIDQATGYLYFVFYDRRNYTDFQTDVYMARSTDGGETFTNFRVSSTPFLPQGSTFFGDYNGITAHNGKVRPIWTRLVSTQLSIWTAIVDFPVGVENITSNTPSEFKLNQNYPNPFNPSTNISYSIKENTFVTLKVYNLLGKEIETLVNENKPAGNYDAVFSTDGKSISTGIYFYKLTAGNFTETRKMTVLK